MHSISSNHFDCNSLPFFSITLSLSFCVALFSIHQFTRETNENDYILICWSCSLLCSTTFCSFLSLRFVFCCCSAFLSFSLVVFRSLYRHVYLHIKSISTTSTCRSGCASTPFIFSLDNLKGCHCAACNKSFAAQVKWNQSSRECVEMWCTHTYTVERERKKANETRKSSINVRLVTMANKERYICKPHKALIRNANNWYIEMAMSLSVVATDYAFAAFFVRFFFIRFVFVSVSVFFIFVIMWDWMLQFETKLEKKGFNSLRPMIELLWWKIVRLVAANTWWTKAASTWTDFSILKIAAALVIKRYSKSFRIVGFVQPQLQPRLLLAKPFAIDDISKSNVHWCAFVHCTRIKLAQMVANISAKWKRCKMVDLLRLFWFATKWKFHSWWPENHTAAR